MTPIHAHPHRMLGKTIENILEKLRFRELEKGSLELVSREVLGHEELVETDGLATLHVVRAHGASPAIDLQMRGPESGKPGRRFEVEPDVELMSLAVGARPTIHKHINNH